MFTIYKTSREAFHDEFYRLNLENEKTTCKLNVMSLLEIEQ